MSYTWCSSTKCAWLTTIWHRFYLWEVLWSHLRCIPICHLLGVIYSFPSLNQPTFLPTKNNLLILLNQCRNIFQMILLYIPFFERKISEILRTSSPRKPEYSDIALLQRFWLLNMLTLDYILKFQVLSLSFMGYISIFLQPTKYFHGRTLATISGIVKLSEKTSFTFF